MGIIDASLGRHVQATNPYPRMSRAAMLAELDGLITSLEGELAGYSDHAWATPGRVSRHDALIRLVNRRNAMLAS